MSCVCSTQLVLLAVTVLQNAICCWLCQKSENYGYEGLEILYRIVVVEFVSVTCTGMLQLPSL